MAVSISELDCENLTGVRVAHLIDPATFWIVPLDDVAKAEDVQTSLTDYFRNNPTDKVTTFAAGELVAVLHPKQEKWMRAEVQEAGDQTSLLFLLDDGMVVNMATSNMRPLPKEFGSDFLAIRLHLRGVRGREQDMERSWSDSAYEHVSVLLHAAEGCYLYTAPEAGDIIDPVLFATLFVHANNQLVDLGADLEQRGFATRSKLNAIEALENYVMEPLCLGPNVHDPRQVSNPMRSTSVQMQIAYEEPSLEQRLLSEAVGRGRQRPLPQVAEQRPIQFFAAGHNMTRLPPAYRRQSARGGVQTSPPPTGGPQARGPQTGGLGRGALMKSPNKSGSSPYSEMGHSSSRETTPVLDSSWQSTGRADSSFADMSMSGSRDSSFTASSAGESPVVGKPSRRQFIDLMTTQLAAARLSDSVSSSDASLLAANDSFSSTASVLAANDSFSSTDSSVPSVPKGRAKRLAMVQAKQSTPAAAGAAAEPAKPKRRHLLDKFRDLSAVESDDPASVSQRQDESLGNLSLMNVSQVVNATPVKMSLSERYRMIAAKQCASPLTLPETEISATGLQEASAKGSLPTTVTETVLQPREDCLEKTDQLPPVPNATVCSAAICSGDATPCVKPTILPNEPPKPQMLLYRLRGRALQQSKPEPEVFLPKDVAKDQENLAKDGGGLGSSQRSVQQHSKPVPEVFLPRDVAKDGENLTKGEGGLGSSQQSIPQHSKPVPEVSVPKDVAKDQESHAKDEGGRGSSQQRVVKGEKRLVENRQDPKHTPQPMPVGLVAKTLAMNRVLVHGRNVRQIPDVHSAPFPKSLHEALYALQVRHPTRLQQVAWPAVVQGDNIVMVAQRTAGMTLAHLAPLVAMLATPSIYKDLRTSCPGMLNGPITVILCPGFEQCQKIEKMCNQLLWDQGVNVVIAHGGGAEQEKEIELLNGCDLLVTTPLCFYRLLAFHKLIVNLRRICHLVLSNADSLVEKFKKQVVPIMESCKESVRRRLEKGGSSNGLQVVATSHRWSQELYAIVNAIVPCPLVVIGSYLEAAIYAGVRPKLDILPAAKKMDQVLAILSEQRGLHKSVVTCQNASKVEAITEMLARNKFYVLEAHEQMLGFKRDDVRHEWMAIKAGAERPVLVVSDPVLEDMLISDATVLVHFDMPASKNGFGKRFSLLMDNYPSIHTANKDTVRDCQAHVLVDEANSEQLPGVVDFMRRLGAQIMPLLEETAKNSLLHRERSKAHLPFCPNMKAFGHCTQDWNLCPSRHALLPSDEPVFVPKSGRVKLKVLQVLSACRFSANLLNIEGLQTATMPLSGQVVRLAMEMALYYATPAHCIATNNAIVNELVALETAPGLYQRCRIEGVLKRDSLMQPISVKVWMLDCGEWHEAEVKNLVELPEPLRAWPEQAVEVILCGAAPTDDDTAWSPAAYAQVCRWVAQVERDEHAGSYFIGDIVLSLGNTLWLDPMQARLSMSMSDIVVRSFRQDLVAQRLAIDNPNHLKRLYEMCTDAEIDVSIYQRKKKLPTAHVSSAGGQPRAPAKPRWQHLRDDPDYQVTFVSASNPGNFFVRLAMFERNLSRLNGDIRSHMAKREAEPRTFLGEEIVIAAGALCLAKYEVDGNWHRALVRSVPDDCTTVEVFFVDHGDNALVKPGSELVPITDWLVEYLPFMAIQCSLAGIKPLDQESWEHGATDLLYDITVNDQEMAKTLDYRIVSKSECATSVSGVEYSVVLIDSLATDDSVLNRVLVERGLAAYDDDSRKHLDELPRIVPPRPLTPPPEEDVELGRAIMPGKVAEDSTPEVVRLSDLANKSVSLTHPEDIELKEGESCFDFEIDDVRTFMFHMMHGKAADADSKLEKLNMLMDSTKPLALAAPGDEPSQTAPRLDTAASKPSPAVPKPSSAGPESPNAHIYAGVPGSATPRVVWYQELRTVHLSIELVDVPKYSFETTAMGVDFSTETRSGDKYALALGLFGAVWPERTEHANTGRRIGVVLHKIYAGNWPQLLAQGDRGQHWLSYNVDHATTATERTVLGVFDDNEGDELTMRDQVRLAQERVHAGSHVSTLPPSWRNDIGPHFQYEESDDEEDPDYIPPDKPYRLEDQLDDQHDPFNHI